MFVFIRAIAGSQLFWFHLVFPKPRRLMDLLGLSVGIMLEFPGCFKASISVSELTVSALDGECGVDVYRPPNLETTDPSIHLHETPAYCLPNRTTLTT